MIYAPRKCPKCGSIAISGPKYERSIPHGVAFYEFLRYTCSQCGYDQMTTATLDKFAAEDAAPLQRKDLSATDSISEALTKNA